MSLFINNVKQLLAGVITSFNSKIWDFYISKRKSFINLKVYKNYEYFFYPKGYITERLYRYGFRNQGTFETKTFEMIDLYLRPGQTVLDIGANIGIYSLYFSEKIGEDGRVYAFEPDRQTFDILQKNLNRNNCHNVIPLNCALSNENGHASIGLPPGFENKKIKYNDAFNVIGKVEATASTETVSHLVEVRILDELIIDNGITKVDLIKMDIEGAELLCMEGAVDTLTKFRPVIVFEGDEERVKNFQYDLTKLLFFMHNLGYRLTNYDSGQWLAVPQKAAN